MQHASLTSFMNGERSAAELWREIEAEVIDCLAACGKGGAGSVILTAGPLTTVSRKQVGVLIAALAESALPMDAASYVADALIMSEDFAWEDRGIVDVLFRLSDESAPLTTSDLEWVRKRLAVAP